MHAAPWSPARSRQHTPNLHGDSLMTTGSTVISGSTRFVAGHVSREASGYPSEDGLQSRPLTASLDLDGTETGSLTSFLTKPRGLLVGRGEGDGGANKLHGPRSMRNLRGGANVLNPRRGKLLEDLKQRSFMFSQSHKPDAREVGKRMREEWVSVLSPNGLAQEVQIWSELDRFRAPTTSRGQATVRRHAQRGAVPAAQRNSRSTEMVHAYDAKHADGEEESNANESQELNSFDGLLLEQLPRDFTLDDFLATREAASPGRGEFPERGPRPPPATGSSGLQIREAEKNEEAGQEILDMASDVDLGEMLPEYESPFPVTSTLDFDNKSDVPSIEEYDADASSYLSQQSSKSSLGGEWKPRTPPPPNVRQRIGGYQFSGYQGAQTNNVANAVPKSMKIAENEEEERFIGAGARQRYFARLKLVCQQQFLMPLAKAPEPAKAPTPPKEVVEGEEDGEEEEEEEEDDDESSDDGVDETLMGEGSFTPRQKYLRAVLKQRTRDGTLPLPVLLRRRLNAPSTLDLNGAGVGDTILISLCKVISGLPTVDTLLLRDNRLTDDSLTPLLEAVRELPRLTALDLSGNDMDDSAATLRDYLGSAYCKLRKLWLATADIDDFECADFMQDLTHNRSLEIISLADNLIGDAENLNIVNPDLTTGGEAIADMLQENYKLQELDVAWNKIRKDSAKELGMALAHNSTLTKLNLAYNAFQDEPAQFLGIALAANGALRELDLSYNAITPTAAMVIASAFTSNSTLHKLDMSGNPLGRRGGEALITAVRRCQLPDRFLHISFANAEMEQENQAGLAHGGVLFNPIHPTGDYTLDMATPYAQMVARELYRLAATRHGCNFKSIFWTPPKGDDEEEEEEKKPSPGKKGKKGKDKKKAVRHIPIELKRKKEKKGGRPGAGRAAAYLRGTGADLDSADNADRAWFKPAKELDRTLKDRKEKRPKIVALLKAMGAKPTRDGVDMVDARLDGAHGGVDGVLAAVFYALFDGIDSNASGSIDVLEMQLGLEHLGVLDRSIEAATRVIATYDLDGSLSIERGEFVQWAMGTFLAKKPEKLDTLVDAKTGGAWVVPTEGWLHIQFTAEPHPPGVDLYCTDLGNEGLVKNMQLCSLESDRAMLFNKAVSNTDIYFTAIQAQSLLDGCENGLDEYEMLEKLLPVMSSTDEACALVEKNLNLDSRVKLRERMGPLFDAVTGNPTGFYMLDLREANHRRAALKLAEVNNAQIMVGRASGRLDTSQKGNWQNFRNEFYEDKALELNSSWFVDMPRRGRLKFDFVSTRRPKKSTRPLSVRRFIQLCQVLELGELSRVSKFYHTMNPIRRERQSFFAPSASGKTGCGASDRDKVAAPGEQRTLKDRGGDAAREMAYRRASRTDVPVPDFDDESTSSSDEFDSDDSSSDSDDGRGNRRKNATKRTGVGSMGTVLGIEMPWWIMRRDVVNQWRDLRASTYVVTDWLGVEKARDMAKILGTAVDEKDTGDKQDTADLMKDGSPESAAAAGEPSAGLTDNVRATHRNYAALESESESESDDEPGFGEFEVLPPSKQARKEKTDSSILPARAYSIVYYKIATLRVATMSIWLSMEQIIWIVKSFPTDDFCRVYVAILLHARCIDMKNYWQIFTILEPQEQLEVLHRLGWLNTQNPVHPERIYVLDLRSWEHREMCKILVKLAVEEPGTNWMDEAYRWSIFDVPVPGWELPISWSTEDYELNGEGGPRRFGRLQLKYTSDPKLGCDPQWEYFFRVRARGARARAARKRRSGTTLPPAGIAISSPSSSSAAKGSTSNYLFGTARFPALGRRRRRRDRREERGLGRDPARGPLRAAVGGIRLRRRRRLAFSVERVELLALEGPPRRRRRLLPLLLQLRAFQRERVRVRDDGAPGAPRAPRRVRRPRQVLDRERDRRRRRLRLRGRRGARRRRRARRHRDGELAEGPPRAGDADEDVGPRRRRGRRRRRGVARVVLRARGARRRRGRLAGGRRRDAGQPRGQPLRMDVHHRPGRRLCRQFQRSRCPSVVRRTSRREILDRRRRLWRTRASISIDLDAEMVKHLTENAASLHYGPN